MAGGVDQLRRACMSDPHIIPRPSLPQAGGVDYTVAGASSSGLVCVWSVHEPSQPKHILRTNSAPLSLAFSPGTDHLT